MNEETKPSSCTDSGAVHHDMRTEWRSPKTIAIPVAWLKPELIKLAVMLVLAASGLAKFYDVDGTAQSNYVRSAGSEAALVIAVSDIARLEARVAKLEGQ